MLTGVSVQPGTLKPINHRRIFPLPRVGARVVAIVAEDTQGAVPNLIDMANDWCRDAQ
ncbi:MAG: hypothetical protein AAF728_06850 [Cyanobacteria bacterium P01_D01_bin.128]